MTTTEGGSNVREIQTNMKSEQKWITNRLPTPQDAQGINIVVPNSCPKGWGKRDYRQMVAGEAWSHMPMMPRYVEPVEPECPKDVIPEGCTVVYKGSGWDNNDIEAEYIVRLKGGSKGCLWNEIPSGNDFLLYWEVIRPVGNKTKVMNSTTPRTDELASKLDLNVLEDDAYVSMVNHALKLERETIEWREAVQQVMSCRLTLACAYQELQDLIEQTKE